MQVCIKIRHIVSGHTAAQASQSFLWRLQRVLPCPNHSCTTYVVQVNHQVSSKSPCPDHVLPTLHLLLLQPSQ